MLNERHSTSPADFERLSKSTLTDDLRPDIFFERRLECADVELPHLKRGQKVESSTAHPAVQPTLLLKSRFPLVSLERALRGASDRKTRRRYQPRTSGFYFEYHISSNSGTVKAYLEILSACRKPRPRTSRKASRNQPKKKNSQRNTHTLESPRIEKHPTPKNAGPTETRRKQAA